ncbi:hypothetical protein ACWC5C_22470 [Streptomyces sp. NPDC001700]
MAEQGEHRAASLSQAASGQRLPTLPVLLAYVPEDPIAHGELSALTRRFAEVAEKNDRGFGITESDLTPVRIQIGDLDQKAGNLDYKVDQLKGDLEELGQKMDRNQAQIVGLLRGRAEPRIVAASVSTTWSEAA